MKTQSKCNENQLNEWMNCRSFGAIKCNGRPNGPTKQTTREQSNSRAASIEDDDDGHLIYKNGDVLQERCTEHILNISLITEHNYRKPRLIDHKLLSHLCSDRTVWSKIGSNHPLNYAFNARASNRVFDYFYSLLFVTQIEIIFAQNFRRNTSDSERLIVFVLTIAPQMKSCRL